MFISYTIPFDFLELDVPDWNMITDIIYALMGGVQVFMIKNIDFMQKRLDPNTFGSNLIFKADVDFDIIVSPQVNYEILVRCINNQWDELRRAIVPQPMGF